MLDEAGCTTNYQYKREGTDRETPICIAKNKNLDVRLIAEETTQSTVNKEIFNKNINLAGILEKPDSIVINKNGIAYATSLDVNVRDIIIAVRATDSSGSKLYFYSINNSGMVNGENDLKSSQIQLKADMQYEVYVMGKSFFGTCGSIMTIVTKDSTRPEVEITADIEHSESEVKTEEKTLKPSNFLLKLDTAGKGLQETIRISDKHLRKEDIQRSLIQICKIDDRIDEKYGDQDIPSFDKDTDEEVEQWINIDDSEYVDVVDGKKVELSADIPKQGYTSKQNWEAVDDAEEPTYEENIRFEKSGTYLIRVLCNDMAGNSSRYLKTAENGKAYKGIIVDTVAPHQIKVNYSSFEQLNGNRFYADKNAIEEYNLPTFDGDWEDGSRVYDSFDAAKNAAASSSVKYYSGSPVTLKIDALDDKADNLTVKVYLIEKDGKPKPDTDDTDTNETNEIFTENGTRHEVTYTINNSFYGTIIIKVKDNAGNSSYISEGLVMIDLYRGNLEIVPDSQTGSGEGNLFFKERSFTIYLKDNYPATGNVRLTGSYGNKQLNWVEQASGYDPSTSETYKTFKAEMKFDTDGEYQFTVDYHEENGTHHDEKSVQKFYIDRTAPKITNSYSNTNLISGKYYNNKQSATLTIVDKFPVKKETVAHVKKNSGNIKDYHIPDTGTSDAYTINIPFEGDGYYEYEASSHDMAGNSSTGDIKDAFVLDTTAPILTKDNVTYERKNAGALAKAINYLTFGYFCNESIEVTITASDATSGIQSITYYTSDVNEGNSKKQVVKGKELAVSEIGNGIDKKLSTTFTLSPNFKGSIFVKAEDYASNEANGGNFLECNALVLKKQAEKKTLKSSITIKELSQPNENGFYNSDFKVQMSAKETYDGMKNVSYKAGSAEQVDIDFEGLSDLTYDWTKIVNIKAKDNDNNDVKVYVAYQDNVGNPKVQKEVSYKVDVTKPILSVTYDNNQALQDTYYKENRVAEIKIEELNFDAKDVLIKITRNGSVVTNMTPSRAAWSTNGITHTAHITFSEDGDYEFSVEYTDLADNKAEYVHEDKFTIDKTKPEISVAYDNNHAQSQQYYAKARTATVTVVEHNFDAANVKVNISRKDKTGSAVPHLSSWSTNGDRHTATVTFNSDGIYVVNVQSTDIAGNEADEWKEEQFTIDLTKPELSITGVENSTAYSGKVIPVLTYSDTNLNPGAVQITVTGYKRGKVPVSYKESTTKNSRVRTLDMFPKKKNVDDVYIINVKVFDKAGNSVSKKILFSVNRFGSNYYIEDETTTKLLNSYAND
ncbi:MAG: hypothetical protein IKL07_05005, partial [Clostridium sp.]|nr:hypothetical protein [Clostridium sp.]